MGQGRRLGFVMNYGCPDDSTPKPRQVEPNCFKDIDCRNYGLDGKTVLMANSRLLYRLSENDKLSCRRLQLEHENVRLLDVSQWSEREYVITYHVGGDTVMCMVEW